MILGMHDYLFWNQRTRLEFGQFIQQIQGIITKCYETKFNDGEQGRTESRQ